MRANERKETTRRASRKIAYIYAQIETVDSATSMPRLKQLAIGNAPERVLNSKPPQNPIPFC